jgi:RNA polymerase sigma-70 factor (ECF subfamily)
MQAMYLQLLARPAPEAVREPLQYLFGVARHVVQSDYRRLARERGRLVSLDERSVDANPEGSGTWWVEDDSSTDLVQEQIERSLRQLPKVCQVAFLLQHRDRQSYKEIAAVLGVTEHTVKKYIVKTLAHLRMQLNANETDR